LSLMLTHVKPGEMQAIQQDLARLLPGARLQILVAGQVIAMGD